MNRIIVALLFAISVAVAETPVEATSKKLSTLVETCRGQRCEAQVHAVEVYWNAVLEKGDPASARPFVEQRIRVIKHDFGIP